MNKKFTALILFTALLCLLPAVAPAADSYNLVETPAFWDGADASRLADSVLAPGNPVYSYDYNYTYGDESSVTYTLPWNFNFYGQTYVKISVFVV